MGSNQNIISQSKNQIMKSKPIQKTQSKIGLRHIESIQNQLNKLVDEFKDRIKGTVDETKPNAINYREFNRLCRRMKSSIEMLNKDCDKVFENPLDN